MSELPIDAYYDLTEVRDVALSPDGSRVAFLADEFDADEDERVAALFVVPTDGTRDPHRLSRVPGAGSPQWAPDGDRLAFLAAREEDAARRVGGPADDGTGSNGQADADGAGESEEDDGAGESEEDDGSEDTPAGADDEPKRQVWLFDLALGGDARQVTDFPEGAAEFDWSPDGDRLVVAARDPTDEERAYLDGREEGGPVETERLQHKLDGVGYTDTVRTYLHVVDVESGEAEKLEGAYGGGAFSGLGGLQPAWGPTDRIAFCAYHGEDEDDTLVTDVFTVAPDGSDKRALTDSDLAASTPEWSPSGERLAFAGADPENWCIPTQVYCWEERGADGGEYESLTADLDRTMARGAALDWVDDGTLYTTIGDEARTRLLRVSVDGTTERVFEAQGDDRALGDVDVAGGRAAFTLSHPSDGKDVYAVDAADLDATDRQDPDSLTRLSEVNADLIEEYAMPEVRRVEWESEGNAISGVVYHDPAVDPEDGDHPLVVAIHGGPVSYDEPVFSFAHAVLTSRGYVVLRPNYRGGSSYGRDFCEALHGQWGTHEVTDVANGVKSMVERGWVDPDRVFGYGFSYGGIAQGFLVTREPDLFTAAAPEHGIYDLRSAFGTDDSHLWMKHEYGYPWEAPEAIDASSSITDVGNLETPLLVTAGRDDWRCPPSQSEQLYVAAKAQGVDARLVVYEDEHHNIGTPDRAIHRLEEVVAWYERHDPAADEGAGTDPHGRVETDE